MSRKLLAFSVLLILASAVAIVTGWQVPGTADESADAGWPSVKVNLAMVERTKMPHVLHAVGELEAIHQVQVSAEVAGRIHRISFTSGQVVQAGQILVQINDAPEQAERLRLTAQLHNAERALARTQVLQASKAMTLEQLDNATAARDMARGELQRIEAVIAQKSIRAPFAGVMGIARVHLGQYLNPGDAIANLVDASGLRTNFALPEQTLAQLRIGQQVAVQVDAWPDEIFSGEINAIDPLVSRARTVSVQANIANPQGRLQAGMFANVRVQMPENVPVLVVPETAITYTAYGQTVFVAEADESQALHVRRVAVNTGQRWQGSAQALVEVVSGLSEGQQVVVSGQIRLSDGMAVMPVTAKDGDGP